MVRLYLKHMCFLGFLAALGLSSAVLVAFVIQWPDLVEQVSANEIHPVSESIVLTHTGWGAGWLAERSLLLSHFNGQWWLLSAENSGVPLAQALFWVVLHPVPLCLLAILWFTLLPVYSVLQKRRNETHMAQSLRTRLEDTAYKVGIAPNLISTAKDEALLDQTVANLQRKMERYRKDLSRMEYADKLTGLANRQQFQLALESILNRAQDNNVCLALLFIDLDGFKRVNDTFGHNAGDQLLVQVANRLRSTVRASDSIVLGRPDDVEGRLARLGGDEFAVILEGIADLAAAEQVAGRIIQALEQTFHLGNNSGNISASIGISMFPDDGGMPEALLQKADVAMYVAKNDGKGTHRRYLPDMGDVVRRHNYLSTELRRALEANELSLSFQPIVALPSCQMTYFEVLSRWEHPEDGHISPAEFIPVAEESRQIVALGNWVMRTALETAAKWYQLGLRRARVSVNVSAIQIQQLDLFEWVQGQLVNAGISGKALMIEITESCLLEATPETLEQMHKLRDIGVQIAIDDFGTGYSSLSMLASLPLDVLKIDRSFVNKAHTARNYRHILSAILQLANELQLEVIAEGVETAEELALLKQLDCNLIQGYYVSKPQSKLQMQQRLFHDQVGALAAAGTASWSVN